MKFQRSKGSVPVLGLTESGQDCSLTIAFVGSVEFERDDKAALADHLRAAASMLDRMPGGAWGEETEPRRHTYTLTESPKMLQETLSWMQMAAGCVPLAPPFGTEVGGVDYNETVRHRTRLQRVIEVCERMRPVGPDGKHGERHTPDCGCEDV